ncbi:hypothetical protein RB195_012000 [Necator americanus]|uniref:Secreted protein n=1 Tax=Necator americanus TaxID=51031 RepID=A0ABR1D529_NECAM
MKLNGISSTTVALAAALAMEPTIATGVESLLALSRTEEMSKAHPAAKYTSLWDCWTSWKTKKSLKSYMRTGS